MIIKTVALRPESSMTSAQFHQKVFLFLLIAVSIAFGWILLPFYGAVFWGVVLAILFAPLYRRMLAAMHQRRNLAALATLLLCLFLVILPLSLITASLIREGAAFYQRVHSQQFDTGAYFQQMLDALPQWMLRLLDRIGLADMPGWREKLTSSVSQGSQMIVTRALSIGQNTLDFLVSLAIMLYLLFFLLRDGAYLTERIRRAIPLSNVHKRQLLDKFTTVIRATVKGNIVVAATQGALGGVMFWILGVQGALLWGVLMAFLSLLPAIGAGLIWGSVAIYFLLTGAFWQGIALIAFGVLVIGLVDNALRPVLVGKDTKMPDYIVLISTLGGMALFGLNGFVIGPVIAALFIAAWDLFSSTSEALE